MSKHRINPFLSNVNKEDNFKKDKPNNFEKVLFYNNNNFNPNFDNFKKPNFDNFKKVNKEDKEEEEEEEVNKQDKNNFKKGKKIDITKLIFEDNKFNNFNNFNNFNFEKVNKPNEEEQDNNYKPPGSNKETNLENNIFLRKNNNKQYVNKFLDNKEQNFNDDKKVTKQEKLEKINNERYEKISDKYDRF